MILTKNYNSFECRAVVEDSVLKELVKLENTYFIFHDVCLTLYRPVRYKNTQKTIKYCQIDYVIVGPTGIFIIEEKEWSEKILKEDNLYPLKESDRAGLIFYIKSINWFHRKFPQYTIVIRPRKVPKAKYGFVYHLTIKELYWFIMRREGYLSKKKIRNIVKWLTKISNRKAIIRARTN